MEFDEHRQEVPMDARTAPKVDPEAASGETVKQQPTAYPHLWFDDRGRPWIDDTNTKVIEVVLDKTAYRISADEINREYPYWSLAQIHSALAYYFDHKQEMDDEI